MRRLPTGSFCQRQRTAFYRHALVFVSSGLQADIPVSDVGTPRTPVADLPKSQSQVRPSTSSSMKLMAFAVTAASGLLLLIFIWWFFGTPEPNVVTPPPPSTSPMQSYNTWGSVGHQECGGTVRLETDQLVISMNLQKVKIA